MSNLLMLKKEKFLITEYQILNVTSDTDRYKTKTK